LTPKQNNKLIIEHSTFIIEISAHSGFCFGVVNAIAKTEAKLRDNEKLYCIGSIVHNDQEVSRLTKKGLQIIDANAVQSLKNKTILFRAHGEPPESYELIKHTGNKLIDATCPVVLKIQQRIKKAYKNSLQSGGQIAIYGKAKHAEVIGLMGQTKNNAILIESESDISKLNFSKPIELFSQTTMPLKNFNEIAQEIEKKACNTIKINDTICRQVSNRQIQLKEFSKQFDIVFFVGDAKSSNSKVLYQVCKTENNESYFIASPLDINGMQLKNKKRIGICGATSTPEWLMKEVALAIETEKLK
jgi:4-hydroxy-3-methylbut-2-enyl diphosphate reductase